VYRYRARIKDRLVAKSIVEHYGRSALDFFKYWPDKSYFFSDSGNSFIAYSVGRNFAVALADPVGPEEEMETILRDFGEFCRENDWRVGFHQTLPDFLPLYEKLGFRKLKLGDDAIADLTTFSLDGKEKKSLRHTVNKLEESGLKTYLYEPPLPQDILSQLEEVSDEWLHLSGHRERRFTLGKFDREYIRNSPVFLARDEIGVILAFVNLIPSYRQGEATIDLMRRRHDAPNGIMDFIFVNLFARLKEQGYTRFNLGMAPMSGFSAEEQASREEKAIHFFFQRMRFLFNYKGLMQYKAKYAALWEPRYAIYRHPLDLPRMALALSRVSEYRSRRDVKLTGFIHAARQSWPAESTLDA
jgi:phosphatidylglycerol lysyltransferase